MKGQTILAADNVPAAAVTNQNSLFYYKNRLKYDYDESYFSFE